MYLHWEATQLGLAGAQAAAMAEREQHANLRGATMTRKRLTSSGLITSGGLCGSLRW
jgi:hypothetical protein